MKAQPRGEHPRQGGRLSGRSLIFCPIVQGDHWGTGCWPAQSPAVRPLLAFLRSTPSLPPDRSLLVLSLLLAMLNALKPGLVRSDPRESTLGQGASGAAQDDERHDSAE
jgi:hypothetical protein